jgi:hypothetical protein
MLGGTNDFSCWSLPPAAALGLRPRRVGQLAAPFPGDFGEFGAAFPRHFGEFGAAFAGDFGESVAAFAGDFGEFGAAFPRDVCQFAAPLGADLESTAQLVSERAVGKRTARRSPDGQRGGHGLRHVAGRVSAAPAQGRLTLGVHCSNDQSTDEAHVGQEGASFVGFAMRIGLIPTGAS